MKKHATILFLAFGCFLGSIGSADSAGEALLHIRGIGGESVVKGYEGWIDLLNWSWELSNENSGQAGGGGGAAGRAVVGPLKVTKFIDKSSPYLTLFLLTGRHIREATMVLRTPGDEGLEYLQITMWDVLVTNVSPGGVANNYRFIETVSFDFSSICYSYTPYQPDGSANAEISKCFDISKNQQFKK